MKIVYVDTGAWIALLRMRDRAHQRVAHHFRAIAKSSLLVTSEPAIAETATRLRHDAGLSAALAFHCYLEEVSKLGRLRVRETDAPLRRQAFAIMEQHADLRLSYADCVGAAVAREARASTVLSLDNDFRVLGFTVEP